MHKCIPKVRNMHILSNGQAVYVGGTKTEKKLRW